MKFSCLGETSVPTMTTGCLSSIRTKGRRHKQQVLQPAVHISLHPGDKPASETSSEFYRRAAGNNWDSATMPSLVKTLHFLFSATVTAISVGLLGFAMSRKWAYTFMECAASNSDQFNGTAEITMTLFDGALKRESCPSFGNQETFKGNVALGQTKANI